MSKSTELVAIDDKKVLEAFSSKDGLLEAINATKQAVNDFEHDMSTGTSRSRTASLAAKVATMKTRLDGMGKDLVADWKTKAKAVDINRKQMRDALDELKIIARAPLTQWEAEQAEKLEAERLEKERLELLEKIEADHELALLMDNEFNRKRQEAIEEAARIEQERIDNENRIRQEREQQIAIDAARKADEEKRQAIEREEIAKKAAIDAEAARIESEKARKESERRAEEQRIQAEADAKESQRRALEQAAIDAERKREEEAKAEAAIIAKREADKKHVGAIRSAAKADLMALGVNEEMAKKIVLAINSEKITNVRIYY